MSNTHESPSNESIVAELQLNEQHSVRAEVVSFVNAGAVLQLATSESRKHLLGAEGHVSFLWEGKRLFQTSVRVDQIIEDGPTPFCQLQLSMVEAPKLSRRDFTTDLIACQIPAEVTWINAHAVGSHHTTVARLGLGKVELRPDEPSASVPDDVYECDMTLNFPAPLGAVRTKSRRLLTSEPGAAIFATKSGPTCLATQLISLWALRSACESPEFEAAPI